MSQHPLLLMPHPLPPPQTTANALSYAVYNIALSPRVQVRGTPGTPVVS
jgi:hypothetical protein